MTARPFPLSRLRGQIDPRKLYIRPGEHALPAQHERAGRAGCSRPPATGSTAGRRKANDACQRLRPSYTVSPAGLRHFHRKPLAGRAPNRPLWGNVCFGPDCVCSTSSSRHSGQGWECLRLTQSGHSHSTHECRLSGQSGHELQYAGQSD